MNNEKPTPWRNPLREYVDGFEGDVFFTREALSGMSHGSGQDATGDPSSRFVLVESTYLRDGRLVYIGNQCGGFTDPSELAGHAFSMAWTWQHEPSESVKPLIHMLNRLRNAGSHIVSIAGDMYPVVSYECELGVARVFVDRKGAGHMVYGVEPEHLELIVID
ncbi:hypothetical protein GCM10009785_07260 [Brooklawnia cerclae]|uniref:Uncharacterized protein n=1 Tax=Brooklawnia cerclae TaxID=349934 RepID=A0ABX0SK46_9ACTN|nr:hypothetical protein [Brooklawnia cerclae]NIH58304.1 hypothetical protein [Brooklawnia cerclae]